MKNKLRNGIALSLIPQIVIVQWISNHPDWVERYYSNGLYPIVSQFFRFILGWIPFSIGEILYTILIIISLRYVFINWKKIKHNRLVFLRDNVMVTAIIYFTFHFCWGLNYYREPLSNKLNISNEATYNELIELSSKLISKTNSLQLYLTHDSLTKVEVPYSKNEILKKSISTYTTITPELPYLKYKNSSIKKSMYSIISCYIGIGGYLNPFTNEAQVNYKTPLFRFPVISNHEIGHQVGYSAENETNFIGYLVTIKSEDPYFQYSAYAYALSYCLNAIHHTNPEQAQKMYQQLNLGVIENYNELKAFHEAYENPFEPIFKSVFSTFLKANNQKDGIKSYGKVVNLMVGYHKKYPF